MISWDEAFGLVKINPIAAWTDEDMQDYIDANGVLVNPLVVRGLPVDRMRAVHRQAHPRRRPAQRALGRAVQDRVRPARVVSTLVLTAHGSADHRSAAVTTAVAEQIRALRPGLDVRVAFCERTAPACRPCSASGR